MRLTIVGCGFVGRALARHYRQRVDSPIRHVTVTTTRDKQRVDLGPLADRVLLCDAGNPDQLFQALQDADLAVFCLGPKGDRQVDGAGYRRTFIDSFICLQGLLPRLTDLQQIVYTSSCSVYGDANGEWVDESSPTEPRDEHAAVLLEAEALINAMAIPQRRRTCILRLAALHGPGRDLDHRFDGLAGLERSGDGQRHSNWVHVDDAAGALHAAIHGGWSGVVNVVDDQPVRLADLLDNALRRNGLEPIRWTGGATPSSCDRRVSNRKLKRLGYKLIHPTTADQSGVLPSSQTP